MGIYPTQKHCNKCNTTKSIENFNKNKSSKDGFSHWCKHCYKEKYYKNPVKPKNQLNLGSHLMTS